MDKNKINYLHLIPFDLGYSFYDIISIDNSKNLYVAEEFLKLLKGYYSSTVNISFMQTFELKRDQNKIFGYKCIDDIVEESICRIQLNENLYVFILISGIGVFVILDNGIKFCELSESNWNSNVFELNYLKRKSQIAILYGEIDGIKVEYFSEERYLMQVFMLNCFEIINRISKQLNLKYRREFSGNINYKNNGLSYVLTVYILEKEYLTFQELKYMLYASFVDELNISKEKADRLIDTFTVDQVFSCKSNYSNYIFSWSAVAVEVNNVPKTFEELFSHIGLRKLINKEIFVQSRWLMADNSLDNVLKSSNNKLIELQRLEGTLEHFEAELCNEINANMTTEEKNILRNIVHTSGVISLYASVKRQISIQRKLKEEYDRKLKKRNTFIVSLFMAIFTASTLYSQINDILNGARENIELLIAMLTVAVGTVIVDYINK